MADPVFRSAYDFLAPSPDANYGSVLPFAYNREGSGAWVQEGSNPRLAMPEWLRSAMQGVVGLGESTQTGALSGDALKVLTSGSMGTGALMAPRGALAAGAARRPYSSNEIAKAQAPHSSGLSVGEAPSGSVLAMDEASRMARATEQGYTIDAYKGAYPYDYNTTPSKNWKGEIIGNKDAIPQPITEFNSPNSPYAGFFSNDPAVANRFAAGFGEGSGSAGSVFPAKLKFENPLVIDGRGMHAAAFQFDGIARRDGTTQELGQFRKAFTEDSPYDGVIIKNTKDEGTVYIPRYPQQARSRFATFDPSRQNDPDMLAARAGGVPVPGFSVAQPSQQPVQQPGFRVAKDMVF